MKFNKRGDFFLQFQLSRVVSILSECSDSLLRQDKLGATKKSNKLKISAKSRVRWNPQHRPKFRRYSMCKIYLENPIERAKNLNSFSHVLLN